MLPLECELLYRCANFMNRCLVSCNEVVNFVARNGIFVQRTASPIGCNAHWCCESVGLLLSQIYNIRKVLVSCFVYTTVPDWVITSVNIVHELLQDCWNRVYLQLLNVHELDCIVETVCIS